ncbi:MAG: Asp-tRNA(Asn)/Glu-tRNA(Gln) amidotransferase subunit GatC [Patescibacteria group bacterium]|nr:Asp-tRNA(Asn)/Glu-tRNA(Gln) amidotransferase subunit GatC [Patescibacteria group bacterium]
MNLSRKEIEKIATLARLQLTGEEKEKFAKELSSILGYVEILHKADTTEADLNLTETETANFTRKDEIADSGSQAEILENAPALEDRFIKVKSVF